MVNESKSMIKLTERVDALEERVKELRYMIGLLAAVTMVVVFVVLG